jgi:hypothetical protein
MTTRRQVLTGVASLAMTGWASAQERPRRMAYLVGNSPAGNAPYRAVLFQELAKLGYREGSRHEQIVALANGQRQVAVYGLTEFADAGGLMSYSFSPIEQYRSAATFIDKILKRRQAGRVAG